MEEMSEREYMWHYRQHQQRRFARGILAGLGITVLLVIGFAVTIWLLSGIDLGAI